MGQYNPPLRDIQFVMHELLNMEAAFKEMPAHIDMDVETMFREEAKEFKACSLLLFETFSRSVAEVEAEDIVKVCDALDEWKIDDRLWTSKIFQLRRKTLENRRYYWLTKLLQKVLTQR